jgi:hypothetical protein
MGWIISQALYEKWHSSQGLVEESSEDTCSDGKQSAPLNGSHTQLVYLWPDKMTAFSRLSPSGMMCRPLTGNRGEDLLMWFREDFLAKTYPVQEREQALPESVAVCGRTWHALSEKYDLNSCSWKIHHSLFPVELDWSSVILPRWGMTVSGQLYQHQTSERPISATGSGYWLTPTTMNIAPTEDRREKRTAYRASVGRKDSPGSLAEEVATLKFWPTPTAHNAKETNAPSEALRNEPTLASRVGGHLNPMWVEWLMNWPIGWTSLKRLNYEHFEYWKKASTETLPDSRGRCLQPLWFEQDPSETPYRPQSNEQHSEQRSYALSVMPRERTQDSERGNLRNMQNSISAETNTQIKTLREQGVRSSKREIISRVAVGVEARVDRLKAIGNGQVPIVAATAFNILRDR